MLNAEDWSQRGGSVLKRYGLALLSVAMALFATRFLSNNWNYIFSTALFFSAILLTVWIGGVGTGICFGDVRFSLRQLLSYSPVQFGNSDFRGSAAAYSFCTIELRLNEEKFRLMETPSRPNQIIMKIKERKNHDISNRICSGLARDSASMDLQR